MNGDGQVEIMAPLEAPNQLVVDEPVGHFTHTHQIKREAICRSLEQGLSTAKRLSLILGVKTRTVNRIYKTYVDQHHTQASMRWALFADVSYLDPHS
jgi:hypothetical protein